MTGRSRDDGPRSDATQRDFEVLHEADLDADDGVSRHEAELLVPANLVYFEGHFPGDPLLPGVVQLDRLALARASARWPDLGPLRSIRRLKFIGPIRPGDRIRVRLERRERNPERVALSIWTGESICTSASLVFGERGEP